MSRPATSQSQEQRAVTKGICIFQCLHMVTHWLKLVDVVAIVIASKLGH